MKLHAEVGWGAAAAVRRQGKSKRVAASLVAAAPGSAEVEVWEGIAMAHLAVHGAGPGRGVCAVLWLCLECQLLAVKPALPL